MNDVVELQSVEAIKRLKARLCRLLDQQRWEEFGSLLTADCEMRFADGPDGSVIGREQLVARISEALSGAQTTHLAHLPDIELLDESSATATWVMEDHIELPADGDARPMHLYGLYHDEYDRGADGHWRLRRSSSEVLRQGSDGR